MPCTNEVFRLGEGPGWWRTPSRPAEVLGRSLVQDPEKEVPKLLLVLTTRDRCGKTQKNDGLQTDRPEAFLVEVMGHKLPTRPRSAVM